MRTNLTSATARNCFIASVIIALCGATAAAAGTHSAISSRCILDTRIRDTGLRLYAERIPLHIGAAVRPQQPDDELQALAVAGVTFIAHNGAGVIMAKDCRSGIKV